MILAGIEYARYGEYNVKPGVAYMPISGTLVAVGTVTRFPDGSTAIKLDRLLKSEAGWNGTIVFGPRAFRYVSLPGPDVNLPRQYYEVDDEARTYRRLKNGDLIRLQLDYSSFVKTNGPLKPDYKVI
jgi:hypothetical protein